MNTKTSLSNQDSQFVTGLLVLVFGFVVVRNAWISDDAYVTFRTVENFIAGYGLGYNPFVRVQAYTHPLWLMLISVIYFIQLKIFGWSSDSGLYFLIMLLSIGVSCATVWWLLNKVAHSALEAKLFLAAVVVLSKAFVDYSTSGLENPLTHLLLALFLWSFLNHTGNFFRLVLIFSLMTLNRLDTGLLMVPALVYVFASERKDWKKNLVALVLGLLPLALWEIFSLFYYGFPFPNTAYAKLNTGIGQRLLIVQGMDYLLNSLNLDVLTLFVILLAGLGVFIEREKRAVVTYVGVALYLVYLVSIGGDFMTGRFLAAPFVVSISLISRFQEFSRPIVFAALLIIAVLGISSTHSPIFGLISPHVENLQVLKDENGISDEKLVYFERSGLVVNGFRDARGGSRYAGSNWVYSGTQNVIVEGAVGLFGYKQGPDVHVLDPFALVDPLLARLPVKDRINWRIGHFEREVPAGYIETLATGQMKISDPNLAEYYGKLSFVITGPLWNWDRILEIWKFNTGQYDYLLNYN